MPLPHPNSSERGLALLSVLWGLAFLSLIAAIVVSSAMASRRETHDVLQQAKFEALANAGINLAILGLLDPNPGARWRVDGAPREVLFDGMRLRIAIQDEYGRIDINAVDQLVLRRVFVSAGLSQSAADGLADKVLDWRDADTLRQLNGAEADDYRLAGASHGPRDGPFQTIDEIKLVMGMDEALYRKLAPVLTVYSHRPMINPYTAPPAVLTALLSDAEQGNAVQQAGGTPIVNGVISPGIPLVNWPFRVRVDVMEREASVYALVTVIRLTDDPERPALVQSYEEMPTRPISTSAEQAP
jgi:general secretion pathway protein K